MKVSSIPTWIENVDKKDQFPTLAQDLEVDIAVVGGGIAGLTTAYFLRKMGKKVALIEKGEIGKDSVTGQTTGFLSMPADTNLSTLSEMYGTRNAKKVWQSQMEAIQMVRKIVKKEKIDCELEDCSEYFYANDTEQGVEVKEEAEFAKSLGFDVDYGFDPELNFPNFGYMEVRNQAKFHSIKYLYGLLTKIKQSGVQIFENTEVTKVNPHDKGVSLLIADKHAVFAKKVVIATYDPIFNPLGIYAKKGMYVSYIYEVEIPKGLFKVGTYDDLDNPYHYFRIDEGKAHDQMVIGGEDHRQDIKIDPKKNFKALEEHLKRLMGTSPYTITRKWTGPIIEPVDGLPMIGAGNNEKTIFIATGFSGTGLTFGTLSGKIISDLLIKGKNSYAKLYNPLRTPTGKQLWKKGIDYSGELIGGAVSNFFKSA